MGAWVLSRLRERSTIIGVSYFLGHLSTAVLTNGSIDWATLAHVATLSLVLILNPENSNANPSVGPGA